MNPQLPTPSSPLRNLLRETRNKTEALLALLTILCGVGFWLLVPRIAQHTSSLGLGIVLFIALLVCVGLMMLLGRIRTIWSVVIVVLVGVPFIVSPSRISLVACILFAAGLASDRAHARSSLLKNTSENWFVPIKTCYASTLTGIALVIAALVLSSSTFAPPNISQLVPEAGIRYTLLNLNKLNGGTPIDPSMSVRDYILSQADAGGSILSRLSPSERDRIVLTSIADFESRFQVSIHPDDTIEDVLHRSTVSFLEKYSAPYAQFFPYISAITLFFALRFLFILFRYVVVVIVMAVVRLLIRAGLVKQGARQITIYYPELA